MAIRYVALRIGTKPSQACCNDKRARNETFRALVIAARKLTRLRRASRAKHDGRGAGGRAAWQNADFQLSK